jgi:UDP-glucose 4-epimerase
VSDSKERDSGRLERAGHHERLEALTGWEAASAPARKVLVAGAAGHFGSFVVEKLPSRLEVVGLDQDEREPPIPPVRGPLYFAPFDKRACEDVFKKEKPDALVHLAFRDDPRTPTHDRYRTNVIGTMRLLEYAARHDVKRVVVLSTGSVYGAHPLNPTFISEDAPLRALERYPEIRDRVEADQYVQAWLYRRPETTTVLLRAAHIVGPHVSSPFIEYLNSSPVPVLLGFDPMVDVVHEDDVISAIELALEARQSGVYNIPGPGPVPLTQVLRTLERTPLPIPHVLAYPTAWLLGRGRVLPIETAHVDFLRYPLVLSGERAKDELDYAPRVSLEKTVRAAKRETPVRGNASHS